MKNVISLLMAVFFCMFAFAQESESYIRNQSASDQTANFRINGTGYFNNVYTNAIRGIVATSNYRSGLVIESSGSINYGITGADGSGFAFRWLSANSSAIDFTANTNELMRLTKAGNLGIGNAAPAYKLTVGGHVSANGMYLSSVPAGNPNFQLRDNAGLLRWGVGSAGTEAGSNSGYNFSILRYNDAGTYVTNNDFVIERSTGNVGVGTQTPKSKFHVGFGKMLLTSSDFSYGQLQILNPNDAETSITLGCNGTGPVTSRTSYARQWVIGINAYNVGMNNLAITNPQTLEKGFVFSYDGRLGIGTNAITTTGYRLFVEEGIRTRKVKVDVDVWADDVFDSAYALQPLHKVETFIKDNKHLPDVPSAEEVKKEGLNLGDNQAVLLRKIEELTLYIINQNKDMELMKQKVQALEAKVK